MQKKLMLSVILILLAVIAFSLFFPAGSGLNRGKSSMTKSDTTMLATAIKGYYTEYGSFPTGTEREIITTLRGGNPHKIVFIELAASQLDDGLFVDRWRHPYHIRILPPKDDRPSSQPAVHVWSDGPNGLDQQGAEDSDDLTSWR